MIFITTRVFDSDFIGINIIAIAVLAIFTKVIYKLPKPGKYVFGAILFSHFLLPYTFNTLRIGLSMALASLGFLYYSERKNMQGLIFFALSLSIQITSIFFLSLMFLSKTEIRLKRLGLATMAGLAVIYLYSDFIVQKYTLYSGFEKPSALSGLSILAIQTTILLYSIIMKSTQVTKGQIKFFLVAMILYAVGMNFYSFMRLLDLTLFASMFHAAMYSSEKIRKSAVLNSSLVIVLGSLLSAALLLKNISEESPVADSKWIPYHTMNNL